MSHPVSNAVYMRNVNVFMERSSVNSAFLFELSSQYRDRFFYAGKLSMKSLSFGFEPTCEVFTSPPATFESIGFFVLCLKIAVGIIIYHWNK